MIARLGDETFEVRGVVLLSSGGGYLGDKV